MTDSIRLARAVADGALPAVDGPILVLRPTEPAILRSVDADLVCWQPFRPAYDQLGQFGATLVEEITGHYPAAIICATRSRAETLGLIAQAWDVVAEDGWIALTGQKTDGIDATIKRLRGVLAVGEVIAKGHGKLALILREGARPDPLDTWRADASAREVAPGYQTAAGVFSADGIDAGSRVLAAGVTPLLKGRVADLGAGWGWLSGEALKAQEAITQIDLYEADRIALDLARGNVTDPRAGFHWADVTTLPKPSLRYDAVIANPPFHTSREGDPGLGQAFVAASARLLAPGGTAYIVANRHLPYEQAFNANFSWWEEMEGSPQFKLFRARRPKSDRKRG
ncbi:16S rRNA (guanine1207-N2)-methyltransferase [Rubricella aquisinus]|uniref:16S rRNA (Guanine1207-N2)-methyltransferase n=1 Tax=Rubricella aquisinus TaxID=2028108 RepID=A0A840WQ09_9RHOB|nr:methyltransferase [Rubricella aquisinus]MBB5517128.1 16S rRNA (guanine1207-N2)-methyltransferase [Rubricella aquisinus]